MFKITNNTLLIGSYIFIILLYIFIYIINDAYLPYYLVFYSISNFILLAYQKKPMLNLKIDKIDGNLALQITNIICGLSLLISYLIISILINNLKFIDEGNNIVIMLFISFIAIEYPLLITVKEREHLKPFYWLYLPLFVLVVIIPVSIFAQNIIIQYTLIRILIHLGIILLTVLPRYKISVFIINKKY